MRRRILTVALAISLISSGLFLAGCNNNTASTETTVSEEGKSQSEKTLGMIQSIDADKNEVTINVMDGKPDGEKGQAPEKPEENATENGTQAPEKPEENATENGTQAPEKPEENATENGTQAPEKPEDNGSQPAGNATTYTISENTVITDKDGKEITLSDLKEKDFVEFTADESQLLSIAISNHSGGPGATGESSSAPSEYQAVNHYQADTSEQSTSQESTGTDENIAWISDSATVSLSEIKASKSSSDSTGGDQSSFYGVGAAYLVTSGTLNISNSTIETDSAGGAGVFAYGEGVANVSDTTITTQKGTSGGIHVAGGGTLHASNLTVETNGESSAAIRSDRGSGTMTVEGGTYTSKGTGSPAVYSTADITVSDATLTATNSEAVCIEGKNSLKLTNCDVSSNMPDNSQNDCKWSVILYQSMSGDSEVGNSDFQMTGGKLSSKSGGLFYTTNTSSSFTLENVSIETEGDPDFFLKCTGNSNQRGWGTQNENGANCTFTAIDQQMNGNILWDSISTLELKITEGSTLTGAVIDDESNAGNGGDGYANITIDKNSSWIVTGNSTVTSLKNQGTIQDKDGNTVSVIGSDGTTYIDGSSEYTITVQSYE